MKPSIFFTTVFGLILSVQTIISSSASGNELKAQSNFDDCSIDLSSNVIVVPDQTKSIQEAIDRVVDKGVVLVKQGTFRGNIVIPSGKKIILHGAGTKKTKIVPIDKLKTTIFISPGSQICINGFTIKGGTNGIKAGEFLKKDKKIILGQPAKSVVVKYTNIEHASNGLLLNTEKVSINKGKITRNLNFGAYVSSPFIEIIGTDISSNIGFGLVIMGGLECLPTDNFYIANISDVDISFNDNPGLTICGPSEVTVHNCDFQGNTKANIQIFNQLSGSTLIESSTIQSAVPTENFRGHGVLAYDSDDISIGGNIIAYNEYAGVLLKDSFGEVANNLIISSFVGIVLINSDGEIGDNYIANNTTGINVSGDSQPEISDSNFFIGNVTNIDSAELPVPPRPEPPQPSEN